MAFSEKFSALLKTAGQPTIESLIEDFENSIFKQYESKTPLKQYRVPINIERDIRIQFLTTLQSNLENAGYKLTTKPFCELRGYFCFCKEVSLCQWTTSIESCPLSACTLIHIYM